MARQVAKDLVLALDFGTTSAKAGLFDAAGRRTATYRVTLRLRHTPGDGVEQDPEEMVRAAQSLLARVAADLPPRCALACAGIACQRSTIVFWDRTTGRARGPAVSWMDRRAERLMGGLADAAGAISRRSGLRLSPHYGAAHIARRFSEDPALAQAASKGRIVAGPVASFILARMGGGARAACDPTLAQRTLLFDPRRMKWDRWLCERFDVPLACLPDLQPSASAWGSIDVGGRTVPVLALAGDQQAAAAAFDLGGDGAGALVHYGTGAFALWPARVPPRQARGLLLSARADAAGRFYHEGTVNTAGAALDVVAGWIGRRALQETLRHETSRSSARRADRFMKNRTAGPDAHEIRKRSSARRPARPIGGIDGNPITPDDPLLVPAFAGLGAPHWDAGARAVLFGLDPKSGPADLVRAALSGIAHRVTDIFEAAGPAQAPRGAIVLSGPLAGLGGLARLQADLTGCSVRVALEPEATLLGIARIAARAAGRPALAPASAGRPLRPRLTAANRSRLREHWQRALAAARTRGRE